MPDDGPDLGYCEECGQFGEVIYVDSSNPVTYCVLHARTPLIMDDDAFDLAFEKAGVPRPKRCRMAFIVGLLSFSRQHDAEAAKERSSWEHWERERRYQ